MRCVDVGKDRAPSVDEVGMQCNNHFVSCSKLVGQSSFNRLSLDSTCSRASVDTFAIAVNDRRK